MPSSSVKGTNREKRAGFFSSSSALALTTAGGLTINNDYDIIYIATVTGATVATIDTSVFKTSVKLSIAANAGGLTIKDDAATPNTIATIAAGTTGTFLLHYNENATHKYSLLDYGA